MTNPKHLSGISGIDFYDILGDGVPDMIVAREDGTVEVYNFETTDEPILKYTYVRPQSSLPGSSAHQPSIVRCRTVLKASPISKVEW